MDQLFHVFPKPPMPTTTLRRRTNYQSSLWDKSQIKSLSAAPTYCFFSIAISDQNSPSSTFRRRTNRNCSSWDCNRTQSQPSTNYFFTEDENLQQRLEKLKEEVRLLIGKEKSLIADQLKLIDCIQQLGVAYHFEEEIKDVLCFINSSIEKLSMEFKDDVYVMALCFRLLRENGFNVPKDSLVKSYRYEKDCFKPDLSHDIRAALSLYEASFLAMEEEDELEEAKEFIIKHLRDHLKRVSLRNQMEDRHITQALELPLHHSIQRLHARLLIEAQELEEKVDPRLLELAKLDFNIAQSIYNTELKELTRWRSDLNLTDEILGFARDWLVESYFSAVCLAFELKFSRCRKEIAKAIYIINIIDDIYDIYGSLEELELFTNAVDSFQVSAIESLPDYMKICIAALFNLLNYQARTVMEEKGFDILPYLKKTWSELCKSYMVEARWSSTGFIPSLEEYLENARISVAAPLISVLAHCLSEDLTTASLENFEFYPNIVLQSSLIVRLYNDLGTSKGETGRGDVPKSIQCYVNEANISKSIAQENIKDMINKYWKKLNGEMISSFHKYEESYKKVVINLPRVAHLMYHNENDGNRDHLNLRRIKDSIISLIIEPIE